MFFKREVNNLAFLKLYLHVIFLIRGGNDGRGDGLGGNCWAATTWGGAGGAEETYWIWCSGVHRRSLLAGCMVIVALHLCDFCLELAFEAMAPVCVCVHIHRGIG
jgi:hypothetical protein